MLDVLGGTPFGTLDSTSTGGPVTPPVVAPTDGGTLTAVSRPGASGGIVDLGETWSSDQVEVRDTTGALGDASTVTALVTLPDGTTLAPTVTTTGTGRYRFEVTPVGGQVQPGLHRVAVTATGGVLGGITRVWTTSYDVDSATPLVGVRDVLAQPWAAGASTLPGDLEQLRWLCLVASDAIGRDLGRAVTARTVTERYSGGRPAVVLAQTPVISVSAVTEAGTALSGTEGVDWTLDEPTSGLLWRGTPQAAGSACWARGVRTVSVTYRAGYLDVPPVLRSVALSVVQQLWQTAGQVPHGSFDGGTLDAAVYGSAGALTAPQRAAYDALRAVALA